MRCPIATTFGVIGKKFTVHILRNLMMLNQTRFNQLSESIGGINPKTLSARLKEMEKQGLIERRVYAESPVRIEYLPTKKCEALLPILEQMAAFSMKYYPEIVFRDGKPKTFRQTIGRQTTRFQ